MSIEYSAETAFEGFVDRITVDEILGWARDAAETNVSIGVELVADDVVIATCKADIFRADLSATFGSGNHGFRFSTKAIPSRTAAAGICVRVSGGSTILPWNGDARSVADDVLQALRERPSPALDSESNSNVDDAVATHFEVANASTVIGWVPRREGSSAADIEILQDGRVVWVGIPHRKLGAHRVGFKVDLVLPKDEEPTFLVSARFAETKKPLGPPISVSVAERYAGHLDFAILEDEVLRLAGWVQDLSRPYDSVAIEITLDGLTTSAQASRPREDLTSAGIGSGKHGFEAVVPTHGKPIGRVDVCIGRHVLFKNVAVELGNSQYSQNITTPPVLPKFPSLRSRAVQGSLDRVDPDFISGWALCPEAPGETLLMDLFINGSYCCSTRAALSRPDVGAKMKTHGNHGFRFELAPYQSCDEDLLVSVVPRHGVPKYTAEKVLKQRPECFLLNKVQLATVAGNIAAASSNRIVSAPKIAFIVLNLDGASFLRSFFESFDRHNRYPNYELVIVDHGSRDESLDICDAWAKKLIVTIIDRGENHSFSASNNFAASQTDADIFVFANNDIIFLQDLGSEIAHILSDQSVGLVGIKLLDPSEGASAPATAIQHLGVHFNWLSRQNFVAPFETRYADHLRDVAQDVFVVPAVTGAFIACRRQDFVGLGGFDEQYHYGYEDVDLCLSCHFLLGKKILSANHLSALHFRGASRNKTGASSSERRAINNERLQEKFGVKMRRQQAADRFGRPGFWTTVAPRIAFAVTDASPEAVAGDYFTAYELAREMVQVSRCQIVFLSKPKWFDLSTIDILIVMLHDYDIRKIENAPPNLIRIGWARNWFDQWATSEWSQDFDAMWASSQAGADFLSSALARHVEVVRIATNLESFASGRPRAKYKSDYCFTGSYFKAPREIFYYLDPDAHVYDFAVFGHGWDEVPKFARYGRGSVPYAEMPDIYASTKLVIDDANSATKQWSSVNSRVFDALAAGALVLTNGRNGAEEVFDGLLPSYANSQELDALIEHYLSNDTVRKERVATLQGIVRERHTYRQRSRQVMAHIQLVSATQLRFAIKIGAPTKQVSPEWGDYHFALGIKRALTRLGHSARIDCLDSWEGRTTIGDDVVLVLRGLSAYRPKSHQINLMWMISHPNSVSVDEPKLYDHVFVASEPYAKTLSALHVVPITTLLQCTDPELFRPDVEPIQDARRLLFVGNSRNTYRKVVRDAVELGYDLDVYGTRWERFLPGKYIKGQNIPNKDLSRHYRSAACLLNDHWDDMREHGFISNRLFDAVACEATVVSDDVPGIKELFGDAVQTYESRDELGRILSGAHNGDGTQDAVRKKMGEKIRTDHSFDVRAREIMRVVTALLEKAGARALVPAMHDKEA